MEKEKTVDPVCSEMNLSTTDETAESKKDSEEKQVPHKKRWKHILEVSGILTIVGLLIAAATMIPDYLSWVKSVSEMKLNLINTGNRYVYASDVLKIGVSNNSDDDKFLTKAVIHVTELRNDDTPSFVSTAKPCDDGTEIDIRICNTGWTDLKDVTIEADPNSDSYKNLKHPEAYQLNLDVMEHGKNYSLGKLTVEDLKDLTASSVVTLKCKIKGEKEDYTAVSCGYYYNSSTGKFSTGGKGDRTEVDHIKYCIQSENGTGTFEYPLEYTCPAHRYEEINFTITADRSCSASYYIELYAMDKLLLKTEENGAHFTISSLNTVAAPESTSPEQY